jgi:hypothetical protein
MRVGRPQDLAMTCHLSWARAGIARLPNHKSGPAELLVVAVERVKVRTPWTMGDLVLTLRMKLNEGSTVY